MKKLLLGGLLLIGFVAFGQEENINKNKFRQLKTELATPNVYRTASGAPGHDYYQQQADYNIALELNDEKQRIDGTETITYINNSPDALDYLWVQLDQNVRAKDSDSRKIATGDMASKISFAQYDAMKNEFDGGFKIEYVKDASNKGMKYTINKTMMRIDLPKTLRAGASVSFNIKWWYNINDRMKIGGRSGYEYFEEDDNYLYTIAQFYPRMAVYNEVEGWQNKQFLGRGEFALPFGDYKVSITVPSDHVIAATGDLKNASSILTSAQRSRLSKARTSEEPVIIITEEEARKAEEAKSKSKKTWVFQADNVRDFAFASSRKFIWDAKGVKLGGKTVMAMSYYPKEGNPLWEKYSTKAVEQTLLTYSKFTFDYPYSKAISVHAASIGMEYPMICFNYGRPEKDGTYSDRVKYGMLGVIIHEVGHNFFPMIINSDERQWTWMDEGLNTFLQYQTEREFDTGFPSRRGPARKIVGYMKGDKSKISPIMTNSESIWQFGNNAYGKPATALNILRETIMGRELFDFAFKTYAQRWMFKHPTPADFFRSMEDASGVDLDWFWRGWFFSTDHVEIGMEDIKWYQVNSQNPATEFAFNTAAKESEPKDIAYQRNETDIKQTMAEGDAGLVDFYNTYDPLKPTVFDEKEYEKLKEKLDEKELASLTDGKNFYEITFSNNGGLVMPLVLSFTFDDGTSELQRIPAEIWKMNTEKITKVFSFDKEVVSIVLDPFLETADTETNNNYWPKRVQPTRFDLYKSKKRTQENPMQLYKRAAEEETSTEK
ncbi:MAG: hypothetical protein ACJAUV_002327 [Flavobacteriales bacterium]|jgi:hypothetical protein